MSPSADEFERAAKFVRDMPESGDTKSTDEQKLAFYKYFKQANEGDCNEPAPGMLNFVGKAKHNAWQSVKGMSKDEAKVKYVETLDSMVANWRDQATQKGF